MKHGMGWCLYILIQLSSHSFPRVIYTYAHELPAKLSYDKHYLQYFLHSGTVCPVVIHHLTQRNAGNGYEGDLQMRQHSQVIHYIHR